MTQDIAPGSFAALLRQRRAAQSRNGAIGGRRILLHVGPHKSGTTSIQHLLETNHLRLPPTHELIRRTEPELRNLTLPIHALRSEADARAALPLLLGAARRLSHRARQAAVTLISHEDLLGILPTRSGVRGLYRLAPLVVPHIARAMAEDGAEIELVFYLRDWGEWKRSLFSYTKGRDGGRPYEPDRFARINDLPGGWDDLLAQLRDGLHPLPLHLLSFDADREAGFMGLSLLRHAGLSADQIAALVRTPPQKVSQPATLIPKFARDSPAG